jgi:hypothetical protein
MIDKIRYWKPARILLSKIYGILEKTNVKILDWLYPNDAIIKFEEKK